ncbi:MAG: DUF4168 domain-containing protein [Brasilonema angustatum HA4187-MV1]|nr:DUF4168 domain-containing protein [Brasilonema angustatum HA4187-MV1]
MFKQILTGSYIFVFLLVSSLSAHAQAPKPTSPSSSPSPQVPGTPQTKVSSEELQKFANSIKQLRVIKQGAVQQMGDVISKSGLSQERFLEIYKSQQNPPEKLKQAMTPQEKQQYEKAVTSLKSIQEKADTNMQQVLQKEGLGLERFNQIQVAVSQDPALKQKVQQMIKS